MLWRERHTLCPVWGVYEIREAGDHRDGPNVQGDSTGRLDCVAVGEFVVVRFNFGPNCLFRHCINYAPTPRSRTEHKPQPTTINRAHTTLHGQHEHRTDFGPGPS